MGRKSRYSEYAKGMKKKADAKAQNFRMCLSEYLLQSGQIHKNDESENRSGFSNGNLQNRSIFICKGMENKCLFLISIGIYNCYKISGIKKGKE